MHSKPLPLPIYMDHNATTPLDPRVLTAMEPFLRDQFGNAASGTHAYGWQAQTAVRKAREQVADLLECEPKQVLWTSGATESNNLAILGLVRAFKNQRPHIVTQATEHKAVLEVCEAAREWGADVTVLNVDSEGRIRLAELEKAITPRTMLVSIMMANNEIGTLQPIAEIAEICKSRGIVFHTDGAQGVGKYPFSLLTTPVDMVSISGHKIYGPKGVGALILRPTNRPFEIKPILFGGDQEQSLRPGTLNVAGIVGFGEASALARSEMDAANERLRNFSHEILRTLEPYFAQIKLNGPRVERLAGNLNLSFPHLQMDDLMLGLSGIAYSSSSACTSGSGKISHVLRAIGLDESLAKSTIRLGLGRQTSSSDVRVVTDKLLKMLEKATLAQTQVARSSL